MTLLKELAEAIVDNKDSCEFAGASHYCYFCGQQWRDTRKPMPHYEDCPVPKAEECLKEEE